MDRGQERRAARGCWALYSDRCGRRRRSASAAGAGKGGVQPRCWGSRRGEAGIRRRVQWPARAEDVFGCGCWAGRRGVRPRCWSVQRGEAEIRRRGVGRRRGGRPDPSGRRGHRAAEAEQGEVAGRGQVLLRRCLVRFNSTSSGSFLKL
ncbi:hypothetical protein GQ55_9G246000 [Panicum hallii var. hallii]|uniref:Uncharacterized protein n=1 Tax=Panicum hallii var. hallii TaxID=1504633 RepID=A0A2T7C6R9_9POAL|nr:hypothetical protein GQ55_9G246000 [Panicum hallii var. hallii]